MKNKNLVTNGVLNILGAAYGLGVVTNTVKGLVNRTTSPQTLTLKASNVTFGDTWLGNAKSLTIFYQYDNQPVFYITGREGATFNIHPDSGNVQADLEGIEGIVTTEIARLASVHELSDVISDSQNLTAFASYGPKNVTNPLRALINPASQSLSITPSNQLFTDPWEGVRKSFVITAYYPGQVPFTDVVAEGAPYSLFFSPALQILSANWGGNDVLNIVRSAVSRRSLSIPASINFFGVDPIPGSRKSLSVVYQYGTFAPQLTTAMEGTVLSIVYDGNVMGYSQPSDPKTLSILFATFGPSDVTNKLSPFITNNKLSITPNTGLFGDPVKGSIKSFTVVYTFGSSDVFSSTCREGQPLTIATPLPLTPGSLTSLKGLYSTGDTIKLQTSYGSYVTVKNNLLTTSTTPNDATTFTISLNPSDSSKFTLHAPDGNYVVINNNGLLGTALTAPAYLIPSLVSDGSICFSIPSTAAGSKPGLVSVNSDGNLTAFGSYIANFSTAFYVQSTFTQLGYEHFLHEINADNQNISVDLLLAKVIWDLTGGMFLALGFSPLMLRQEVGPGLYALIFGNQTLRTTIESAINYASANPGNTAIIISVFFRVVSEIWNQGLLWSVLRLLFSFGLSLVTGFVLTTIARVIFPAAGAAEILVSFGTWAYGTTNDCIAYANSTSGSTKFVEYLSNLSEPQNIIPVEIETNKADPQV